MVRPRSCDPAGDQPISTAGTPAPATNAPPTRPLQFVVPPAAPTQLLWGFPAPPVQALGATATDLDLEWPTPPPPPPGRPPRDADEVDLVLETPASQLPAPSGSVGFKAGDAAFASIFSPASVGGRLACLNAGKEPSTNEQANAHSSTSNGEGLEAEGTAPWVFVTSRRPRPPALPAPAFKPSSSLPEWIQNRCFHCLKPRHQAKNCRSPVTCRRCYLPGHHAKGCCNKPAPHRRPGIVSEQARPRPASVSHSLRPTSPPTRPGLPARLPQPPIRSTTPTQLPPPPPLPAWNWLACFNAGKEPSTDAQAHAHSSTPTREGLETEGTAPRMFVTSRWPCPRAFPALAFKLNSSLPEWIQNRCFHCLKPRHRAKNCRSPVTCRRCYLPGHRAKGCCNKPAPHRRLGIVSEQARGHERISCLVQPGRRRDGRDDDNGRRRDGGQDHLGRDASRTGEGRGACIHRSLSRAPRDNSRDRGRERQDIRRNDQRPLQQGSGSSSAAPVRASEHAVVLPPLPEGHQDTTRERGRNSVRPPSPRTGRSRSMDNLALATSPRLSPTSSPMIQDAVCPDLIDMCSPVVILRPLVSLSPERPPGFEASPTPPLHCIGSLRRTPSPPRARPVVTGMEGLEALFIPGQQPLLATPVSLPPIPATARRKTLAGVDICNKGGFALRRSSARLQASGRTRKEPVAKQAQTLVCCSLGIIQDGEDITKKALDDFAARFKNELPDDVLGAMRAFFRLDDALINAGEEGLIGHGGSSGLDHDEVGTQAAVV